MLRGSSEILKIFILKIGGRNYLSLARIRSHLGWGVASFLNPGHTPTFEGGGFSTFKILDCIGLF